MLSRTLTRSVAVGVAASAVAGAGHVLAWPMTPPKYRSASLVVAANTISGGSPRATSVASRRSAACSSAS